MIRIIGTFCATLYNMEPSDPNEVITRLRSELRQSISMIDEVRLALTSDKEFDGLSFVGGVKAILKAYKEEKEKTFQLEKELRSLTLNRR